MLRDRLSSLLTSLAASRARLAVYVAAVLLTAGSGILIPGLEIQTARQGMVSNDIPVQAEYEAYMADFGTPNQLIVVLTGDPETVRQAADDAAEAILKETEHVRTVFHRVDMSTFRDAGLYFVDTKYLEATRDFLTEDPARAHLLTSARDLPALMGFMESALSDASEEVLEGGFVDEMDRALGSWQATLEGKAGAPLDIPGAFERLAAQEGANSSITDADGYFVSWDRRSAFLFVQPAKGSDDGSVIASFMDAVRARVDEALVKHPGVTAGYTGWPALVDEDQAMILSELPKVSVIATVLILVIFLVAFRSIHRTILVFIPLVLGVVWNLGLTIFTIGHLNFLSSVFVGILFGMGIDFGIYFIRRFDEERLAGLSDVEAIRRTLQTAGKGIVTGGVSATVAFLAIGFTDQPAFAELGIVAGTGVFSVLVATLLLLPPLLIQFPPKLTTTRREAGSPLMERITRALLVRPVPLVVVLLAVTALFAARMPKLQFDINLNNLMPADSDALRVLRQVEKTSQISDQFVVVIADNLDQVRALQEKLSALDTVERVESVAQAIPVDEEKKQAVLAQIREAIGDGPVGDGETRPDLAALTTRLDSFTARLEAAEEDAFSAGKQKALAAVGTLLARMGAIRAALDGPQAAERQVAFEEGLFAQRDAIAKELRRMTGAEPITLDDLDPRLRERFVGHSGRMVLYVFPQEEIWDFAFLNRYVNEVRATAEEVIGEKDMNWRVTGFAVTYQITSPLIRNGFHQATWAAGIVVVLMLLFDLRRPRPVLLALAPLVITVVILIGGMAWLGIALNMATQIAFPILFGLGVAYGVHMIHRWSEPEGPDLPRVVGSTGKAIWLAALTTMAGFGALMTAHHSAMVAFGTVLFLGILIAAIIALYGLPVMLAALGMGHDLHRHKKK